MDEPIIKVEHLTKIYPDSDYRALDDISFTVKEGEVLGISGTSGSGKTTLLGIIGCLEKPTEGSITLFGEHIEKLDDQKLSQIRLREIGFIFQEHNLIPSLTVIENIMLPITLLRGRREMEKQNAIDLLRKVGLGELNNRYPSQLSRGQRQRIAAVRALVNKPRIVLADEPTSDLDPENARIILDFLSELNKSNGTTVIIGATDPGAFMSINSTSLKLKDGKIIP